MISACLIPYFQMPLLLAQIRRPSMGRMNSLQCISVVVQEKSLLLNRHIETIVSLFNKSVTEIDLQTDITFGGNSRAMINKLIDYNVSIIIGSNLESSVPHIPTCRQYLLSLALIYPHTHIYRLPQKHLKYSLGMPYDVIAVNVCKCSYEHL